MLIAAAISFVVVESPGSQRSINRLFSNPFDVVVATLIMIEAIWAVHLGRAQPRLSFGPRGIRDHATGRGLLLWTDFQDVTAEKPSVGRLRFSKLRLHASADVCWHYNQRVPAWRRLTGARIFGTKSLVLHVVAVDHDVDWLEAEVARRLRERNHR